MVVKCELMDNKLASHVLATVIHAQWHVLHYIIWHFWGLMTFAKIYQKQQSAAFRSSLHLFNQNITKLQNVCFNQIKPDWRAASAWWLLTFRQVRPRRWPRVEILRPLFFVTDAAANQLAFIPRGGFLIDNELTNVSLVTLVITTLTLPLNKRYAQG